MNRLTNLKTKLVQRVEYFSVNFVGYLLILSMSLPLPALSATRGPTPFVFAHEIERYISTYNQIFPAAEFQSSELQFLVSESRSQTSSSDVTDQVDQDGAGLSREAREFLKTADQHEGLNRQVEALVLRLYQSEDADEFEMILQELMYRYLVEAHSRRALNLFFTKVISLYYTDEEMRARLQEDSFAHHYTSAMVPAGIATFGLWFYCARRPLQCKGFNPAQIWNKWRLRIKGQADVVSADTIAEGRRLTPYLMERSREGGWRSRQTFRQSSDSGVLRRKIDIRLKRDPNRTGFNAGAEGVAGSGPVAARVRRSLESLRTAEARLSEMFQTIFGRLSARQTLSDLVAWSAATFGMAFPIAGSTYGAHKFAWFAALDLDLQKEYHVFNTVALYQLQCAVNSLEDHVLGHQDPAKQNGAGRQMIQREDLAQNALTLTEIAATYNYLMRVDAGLGSPTGWPEGLTRDALTGTLMFRGQSLGECEGDPAAGQAISLVTIGKQLSRLVQTMKARNRELVAWQAEQTVQRFVGDFVSYEQKSERQKGADWSSAGSDSANEAVKSDQTLMQIRVNHLDLADAQIPTAELIEDFFRVHYEPAYTTREPRRLAEFLLDQLDPKSFNELMMKSLWTFINARAEQAPRRMALLALFNEISKELVERRTQGRGGAVQTEAKSSVEISGLLFSLIRQEPIAQEALPGSKSETTMSIDLRREADVRAQAQSEQDKEIDDLFAALKAHQKEWVVSGWLWPIVSSVDETQGSLWRAWRAPEAQSQVDQAQVRELWKGWLTDLGEAYMDPFVVVGLGVQGAVMSEACTWKEFQRLHNDAQIIREIEATADLQSRELRRQDWVAGRWRDLQAAGLVREVSDLARLLDLTFASVKAVDTQANGESGVFTCQSGPEQQGAGVADAHFEGGPLVLVNAWATLRGLSVELNQYVEFLEKQATRAGDYQLKME